jgi:hypothetical protein
MEIDHGEQQFLPDVGSNKLQTFSSATVRKEGSGKEVGSARSSGAVYRDYGNDAVRSDRVIHSIVTIPANSRVNILCTPTLHGWSPHPSAEVHNCRTAILAVASRPLHDVVIGDSTGASAETPQLGRVNFGAQ